MIVLVFFFSFLNSEFQFDHLRTVFHSGGREYRENNEETCGQAPFCKLCNFSTTFSFHLQRHNNTEKHLGYCGIGVPTTDYLVNARLTNTLMSMNTRYDQLTTGN